ncbi:MAG: tyrosine-type recombinase/integrase [Acidobacteria bacterium]|nr:tyrosine-type recombinase/integrase [Acidobacteriota bacterium]
MLPRFGRLSLAEITRFDVQAWLDSLELSRSYIKKLRNLLHGIFEEACDQEYLDRNPARRTQVHQGRKSCDRFLALSEIAILENLDGRERLVFHMLTLLGVRPGELFARRWRDWQGNQLFIADDVWRGTLDETKTAASKAFVWLPRLLASELTAYRASVRWRDPEDFIFCFRRGTPLDAHNYLRRVLKPRCDALQVPNVTFQCFRRTCSTYLVKYGGNIKDAQAHLRHANATTTLGIYTKEIPESVKAAVEDLSRVLFPKAASFAQGQLFAKGRVN